MNPDRARTIGAALLGLGALAMLGQTGIFGALPSFVWVTGLFVLGAAIWVYGEGKFNLGQRIVLFGAVGLLATITSGRFSGTAVLGFIAMAFLLVWLRDNRHWWALIPGGVMSGLSVITALEVLFPRWDTGPLFLLFLAGTFTLLYLMPSERGGQRWALIPAVVLIIVTVLANDPLSGSPGWVVPIAMIGVGFYLLTQWQSGKKDKERRDRQDR